MSEAAPSLQILRFGVFELDLRAGELRKQGLKIRLQEKPLQVLALLLEKPGEVVTRNDLRLRLWPPDTFVDFDHSLGTAINKLREALGDSAESPHFIETLPRHGYRFIGHVEPVRVVRTPQAAEAFQPAPAELGSTLVPGQPAAVPAPVVAEHPPMAVKDGRERRRWLAFVAVAALAAMVVFGTLFAFNVAGLRGRLLSSARASHGAPLPKIESIAVLPFENLSGDPQQEYFADGMTEELITDLGKISALRVISRQSVMRYKGSKKPLPEIGRELHVDAIVESTVRRSGGRVRITTNLLHAPTERQLWAQTYERDLGDVLVLQSGVARAIASQIRIKVTPQENARLAAQHSVNPQAYTAYLKGQYDYAKQNEQGYRKSAEYFEQAIGLQPDFALAHARLAYSYASLGNTEFLSPHEAYPKAEAAALRALEIDGALPDAHCALGWIRFRYDWDWTGAEAEYRRAIELSPGTAVFHYNYGWYLTLMGRWAQASNEIKRAQMLDPLYVYNHTLMGDFFCGSHQFDRAVDHLQKTIAIFGTEGHGYTYSALARAYLAKGMFDAAIAEQQKAITLWGDSPLLLAMLGNMYGSAGKKAEAVRVLNRLKEQSKRKYVSPYDIALVYTGLGDKDQAFSWLEKAYQARSNDMSNLKVDPMFDSLRSDPRFQAILRRMNFPP